MGHTFPDKEATPPKLNPSNVPEQFRHLIPLAEKYGVTDDCYRDDLIESLDQDELKECASFLESYDAVLNQWLADPNLSKAPITQEYIAFSVLGMAADLAKGKL